MVYLQNVRGMGMPPRAGIQSSQQRYPPPIQRPVVPFPPGGPNQNQGQQQGNCIQSQQQMQINRHRSNLHQQQQQRNMKMHQPYYGAQSEFFKTWSSFLSTKMVSERCIRERPFCVCKKLLPKKCIARALEKKHVFEEMLNCRQRENGIW